MPLRPLTFCSERRPPAAWAEGAANARIDRASWPNGPNRDESALRRFGQPAAGYPGEPRRPGRSRAYSGARADSAERPRRERFAEMNEGTYETSFCTLPWQPLPACLCLSHISNMLPVAYEPGQSGFRKRNGRDCGTRGTTLAHVATTIRSFNQRPGNWRAGP